MKPIGAPRHVYPILEVICGPMFCGKTEELVRRVRRAEIGRLETRVFFPAHDTRCPDGQVVARSGPTTKATRVETAAGVLDHVKNGISVVAIDEAQFFGMDLVRVVRTLITDGRRTIVAGLDLDFAGRPFGPMPDILAMADRVDKLPAVCLRCGSPTATRTQRLIDGKPASLSSPLVLIGDHETYEARCSRCYQPPR